MAGVLIRAALAIAVLFASSILAERPHTNRDLYMALRTRVLTKAEMARVLELGDKLLEDPCIDSGSDGNWRSMAGCGSNPELNAKLFNDAILQQFKLRIAAEAAHNCGSKP